jgi:hypothetical protein
MCTTPTRDTNEVPGPGKDCCKFCLLLGLSGQPIPAKYLSALPCSDLHPRDINHEWMACRRRPPLASTGCVGGGELLLCDAAVNRHT